MSEKNKLDISLCPPVVPGFSTLDGLANNQQVHLPQSRLLATAATCLGLLATQAGPAHAAELSPPSGGPRGQVGMSDERTETRWAYANTNSPVRPWPSPHSKSRFPLRLQAPDDTPEVYMVRSTWRAPNGRAWARIRIPGEAGHPQPREGWVVRSALGRFGISRTAIRINRQRYQLTMYQDGKAVLRTPVGIGAPGKPTPAGRFWVRRRVAVKPGMNFGMLAGKIIPGRVFGPNILMTSAHSPVDDNWPNGGIIGIHGTDRPDLIPGRPSNGCVRVPNERIRHIFRLARIGTPIEII